MVATWCSDRVDMQDLFSDIERTRPDSMQDINLDVERIHANYTENKSILVNLIHSTQALVAQLCTATGLEYPVELENNPDSTFRTTRTSLTILSFDSAKHNKTQLLNLSSHHLQAILQSKLKDASLHLDKLLCRILDVKSRVLVTGDVNAGKSTFVNAMLRREIVPDDQQPCTAIFAEVIDADQNDGLEEVHGIMHKANYDKLNQSTFDRIDLRYLRETVEDNLKGYKLLKVYCKDCRPEAHSLLRNGIVDISLIDSPGLNIDTMKTSSLFAKQEEIDVVIFLVNAENHFTLSGREFLAIAGREKAYIFFVINKFDLIRRKERCKMDILNQIKEISPTTYKDAENLVHFVSAKQCLTDKDSSDQLENFSDFTKLEDNLRSFILTKRTQSKLLPIKTFLLNLLQDIQTITAFNTQKTQTNLYKLQQIQKENSPLYDSLLHIQHEIIQRTDVDIDLKAHQLSQQITPLLSTFSQNLDKYIQNISFPRLFSFKYSKKVKQVLDRLAKSKIEKCTLLAVQEVTESVYTLETVAFKYFDTGKALLDETAVKNAFMVNDEIVLPNVLWSWKSVLRDVGVGIGVLVFGLIGFNLGDFRLLQISSKDVFLGTSAIGFGLFMYGVTDVKRSIQRQVADNLKTHFKQTRFVEATIERYEKSYKRTMRTAYWEFGREFGNTFDRVERIRKEVAVDVERIKDKEYTWNLIAQDCSLLFKTVNMLKM